MIQYFQNDIANKSFNSFTKYHNNVHFRMILGWCHFSNVRDIWLKDMTLFSYLLKNARQTFLGFRDVRFWSSTIQDVGSWLLSCGHKPVIKPLDYCKST